MATLPSHRLAFLIRRAARSIWVRPAAYALAAVLALALGPLSSRAVPDAYLALLAPEAVENLLALLASSMLAVAIFSLGTMVSAFEAAASSATPRARPLVAEDRTAQVAIATFIGAFLFGVLGRVGLALGLFDAGGRLILFVLAVALVIVVVTTLIGWLQSLTGMGGVTEAVALVEAATAEAFAAHVEAPFLGGVPATLVPVAGTPLRLDRFGYVQHVDAAALAALADRLDAEVHLRVRPGAWIDPTVPVVVVARPLDGDARSELEVAFTIGRQRTFDVDPGFGLRVLAEIAERALSPGINDPGTALDVIAATTRTLGTWQARLHAATPAVSYPRLRVPPLTGEAVLADAFDAIARHGAGDVEVAITLQRRLAALAELGDGAFAMAARATAQRARVLAEARLDAVDRRRLAAVIEAVDPAHALQGNTPRR